jgi:hypothetical protein
MNGPSSHDRPVVHGNSNLAKTLKLSRRMATCCIRSGRSANDPIREDWRNNVDFQAWSNLLVQVHVEWKDGSRINPSAQPKHGPPDGSFAPIFPSKGRSRHPRQKRNPHSEEFLHRKKGRYTSRPPCHFCTMSPLSSSTLECAQRNVIASNGRTSIGMVAGTERS